MSFGKSSSLWISQVSGAMFTLPSKRPLKRADLNRNVSVCIQALVWVWSAPGLFIINVDKIQTLLLKVEWNGSMGPHSHQTESQSWSIWSLWWMTDRQNFHFRQFIFSTCSTAGLSQPTEPAIHRDHGSHLCLGLLNATPLCAPLHHVRDSPVEVSVCFWSIIGGWVKLSVSQYLTLLSDVSQRCNNLQIPWGNFVFTFVPFHRGSEVRLDYTAGGHDDTGWFSVLLSGGKEAGGFNSCWDTSVWTPPADNSSINQAVLSSPGGITSGAISLMKAIFDALVFPCYAPLHSITSKILV